MPAPFALFTRDEPARIGPVHACLTVLRALAHIDPADDRSYREGLWCGRNHERECGSRAVYLSESAAGGAAWDPMRWWWHTTMLGIPIVNPVEAANISDQLSAAGFLNGLPGTSLPETQV